MTLGVPLASLALGRPALRRAHRGRLDAVRQMEQWATAHRDPDRPLAWFHAASVGESLQARAVIAELRRIAPRFQVVATRFSASADRLADTMGADFTGYLPYDRLGDVNRALRALDPTMLVFSKLDLWPELATRAAATGARVALVAGSVDPGSARLGWTRHFTRRGYAAVDLAAVISNADGERLTMLGTPAERIVVTGDPRVDSVLDRVEQLRSEWPESPDPALLVAGSTWPEDESVLLDALQSVRHSHADARILMVPHEPSPERIAHIVTLAEARGLTTARWERGLAITAAVTWVDQVGTLAALYSLGATAYVGGGFGRRGIHSVLEPAAWGVPIIIGPNDRGVRDARILADAGGLVRLGQGGAATELARKWLGWLDPEAAQTAGRAAMAALAADRGAALRTAELLVAPR